MGMQHHGDAEQIAHIRRMLGQIDGTARREYPAGRMGHEDDGALSYAIATDDRHRTIVIRFGKPVEWIGLSIADAEQLIDNLNARIVAIRSGEVV